MGVKIRNIEDQVPAAAGDDPAMLQSYMNSLAMTLLIVLVVVVGVWSMWIVPKVEPDAEPAKVAVGSDKHKNLSDKKKDSGKNKAGRNKDKKQPKGSAVERDEKSSIAPDVSEYSQRDDGEIDDDKLGVSGGEEEEEWVDVPINSMKKSSVTFAEDPIEARDEDYEPPSDTSPSGGTHKESRDKNGASKKKEKETPEQKQARLERKAQAKKQKEQQEAEEKRLFEEKLKASEMAARLQAEEDAKAKAERDAKAAALARPDEADWVVHTKKVDRRVKTFEELLEERMAKAVAAAADAEKTEGAEGEAAIVSGEALTGSNKSTSSKSNSSSGSGKNNKKGKAKKDKETADVKEEREGGSSNNINAGNNKKEKKPRNDKKKDKKEVSKGKQQPQPQGDAVKGGGEQSAEVQKQWGSLGKIVVGGEDSAPDPRDIGAPPGLTQLGADRPNYRAKEGRGGGQLYIHPTSRGVHQSPGRGKTSPAAAGVPSVPAMPSGGDALWSGAIDPLPTLPTLPLPRMSEAESAYGNPHGGVGIIRRPGSGPSSKENTPRVDYEPMSLSDLEKSLMSFTK